MALTSKILIDGQEVLFRASAALPRLYRVKFHRDIYRDLNSLTSYALDENGEGVSSDATSMETLENIAWLMARHADPSVPDTPEEWLEGFSMFGLVSALPGILELWGLNLERGVEAKKKPGSPKGK